MSESTVAKLEVDLDAYAHNLGVVRERIPKDCGIMAIVKANAYGMGAVRVAQRALAEGAAMLGVATVEEGQALREAGIESPILVMVHPPQGALAPAIEHRLTLMISDLDTADRLGGLARKLKKVALIHCEVDTGMGRQGMNAEKAAGILQDLTRLSNIDIEGIATHFPVADDVSDPFTQNQIRNFRQLLRQLDKGGIPYEMVHAANSAAIVNFPNSAFDLVRPGIMTFGVWPSVTTPSDNPLKAVARWTSQIVLVKDLPGGASISYDRTFKAEGPMRAASVPVGYADGYRRRLSNRAEVLVRGQRCPVRGNICMDSMVVDVTHIKGAAVGDEVTLMGQDGEARISVEELADKADTIPYEILTGIGPRLSRVYTGS